MANGLFGGGTGTALDPYLVEDIHDFYNVRNFMGTQYTNNPGTPFFLQTQDIDAGVDPFNTATGFPGVALVGVYDGGNHRIYNLSLVRSATTGTHGTGLFTSVGVVTLSRTGEAVIRNLRVEGSLTVSGGGFVGFLVGSLRSGTIENCHVQGDIIRPSTFVGSATAGGLVGAATSASRNVSHINRCSYRGQIYMDRSTMPEVGGILGRFGSGTSSCSCIITNCLVGVQVNLIQYTFQSPSNDAGGHIGGLVGRLWTSYSPSWYGITSFVAENNVVDLHTMRGVVSTNAGLIGSHSNFIYETVPEDFVLTSLQNNTVHIDRFLSNKFVQLIQLGLPPNPDVFSHMAAIRVSPEEPVYYERVANNYSNVKYFGRVYRDEALGFFDPNLGLDLFANKSRGAYATANTAAVIDGVEIPVNRSLLLLYDAIGTPPITDFAVTTSTIQDPYNVALEPSPQRTVSQEGVSVPLETLNTFAFYNDTVGLDMTTIWGIEDGAPPYLQPFYSYYHRTQEQPPQAPSSAINNLILNMVLGKQIFPLG
jgi:hypothetical protein